MAMIYLLLSLWLVVRLEDRAVVFVQPFSSLPGFKNASFFFFLRGCSHELIGQPVTCQSMACSLLISHFQMDSDRLEPRTSRW